MITFDKTRNHFISIIILALNSVIFIDVSIVIISVSVQGKMGFPPSFVLSPCPTRIALTAVSLFFTSNCIQHFVINQPVRKKTRSANTLKCICIFVMFLKFAHAITNHFSEKFIYCSARRLLYTKTVYTIRISLSFHYVFLSPKLIPFRRCEALNQALVFLAMPNFSSLPKETFFFKERFGRVDTRALFRVITSLSEHFYSSPSSGKLYPSKNPPQRAATRSCRIDITWNS